VLHRDIKPENVLVDVAGHCKLADFGVAAVVEGVDSRDTAPEALLGTVLHLAPEVLEGGRASVGSDIYSLGSTLATLALGKAPFSRTEDDTVIPLMMRIARDPLPDLRAAGLHDRVAAAIEMAMAKDPDERFGSAAAFGNALQQIEQRIDLPVTPMRVERPTLPPMPAAQGGVAAAADAPDAATQAIPAVAAYTEPVPDPPPAAPPKRRGSLVAAALVAVLVAAVVGFLLTRQDDGDPPPPTTTSSTSTVPTTTTKPLPGEAAATDGDAIRAAEQLGRDRGLQLDVVNTNAYLGPRGLGLMTAAVPDGRHYLVVFFDGHVIGFDFAEPSWTVRVVDQDSTSFEAAYGLYAPGQGAPPSAPTGEKRIRFDWDAERARLIAQNGPVPPTDQDVDGHR
jgi:hypothetical protein